MRAAAAPLTYRLTFVGIQLSHVLAPRSRLRAIGLGTVMAPLLSLWPAPVVGPSVTDLDPIPFEPRPSALPLSVPTSVGAVGRPCRGLR